MEINVKEIEYCKLDVEYIANAEEILNKRAEILKTFKKAPVPGFRPGKANLNAIKTYYRNQIEDALKRALAEESYHNTLFEKKYRPLGAPKFNKLTMETDKFTCQFEMCVKPDFELSNYRDFEIPKPHQEMTVSEVTEKMLQNLRIKYGDSIPYTEEEFAQFGDNAIIDYEGFLNGEKVDNLSASGEMITVGYSQLANFDENLIGMKLGESKEFDLVIPETGLPSFAGKTIHFKVTLTMGAKNIPCALDDTLAIKIGRNDMKELRELIGKSAMARIAETERVKIAESIINRLLDNIKFNCPNYLVLSEAKYITHNAQVEWESLADIDKEKYMELAAKNVRLSLILDKIRDMEPEAQISDQEVFEVIKQNIVKSGKNPDDTIKEMTRTGYLQVLFSRIKDEYVLDFIIKTLKIVD